MTYKNNIGPIYGIELIDTLPIGGGPMLQQMPSRKDLQAAAIRSERATAGYEVLLSHYYESQRQLNEARSVARDIAEQLGVDCPHRVEWLERLATKHEWLEQ